MNVVITGASRGIGYELVKLFLAEGHRVLAISRNEEKLNTLKIKGATTLAFDLCKDSYQPIINTVSSFGHIDIVINNAGVGITGPIEETPSSEIKKAFDINLHGPINVIKSVLPQMRKQKSGLIINITSIAGFMGLPYRGIYSATKAALEITAEAFRIEIKQFGIEMTNIAPGDFATKIADGRYHAPVISQSPYKKDYSNTLEIMNSHVSSGKDPKDLAQIVYQIIRSKNPRVRYKEGSLLQKFSIVLKRVLPSRWYEKMLMNHYKLK